MFLPSYCERGAIQHPGKTDVFFFYIPLVINSHHHVCPVETLYRFSPAVSFLAPFFLKKNQHQHPITVNNKNSSRYKVILQDINIM